MKKFVVRYGLIGGAMLSVMMAVTQAFITDIGFDYGMVIGYSTMMLSFLMVYFGVRAYRDTVLNGVISFGTALKTGLLISLISTLCYVATWEVIYFGGFAKNFDAGWAEHSIAKSRAAGKSQADIDAEVKEMADFQAMYKNPLINVGFTFLEPLPVALLFSLVSAGILSRKRGNAVAETLRARTEPSAS